MRVKKFEELINNAKDKNKFLCGHATVTVYFCDILDDFKQQVSEYDFLWCRSIVGSRNFGLTIDNNN